MHASLFVCVSLVCVSVSICVRARALACVRACVTVRVCMCECVRVCVDEEKGAVRVCLAVDANQLEMVTGRDGDGESSEWDGS